MDESNSSPFKDFFEPSYGELKNTDSGFIYGVDGRQDFGGLTNGIRICGSFCFACPQNLSAIRLSKAVIITRRKIRFGELTYPLNEAKFRMLCAFKRYENTTLSREFLLEYTWGAQGKTANNVNVMVSALRSLLANTGVEILTIRNSGYLMTYESPKTF